MSCETIGLFEESPYIIELVAGVALENILPSITANITTGGVTTPIDLTDCTAEWDFRDSDNGTRRLLLSSAYGSLILNAGDVLGVIVPVTTGAQITAMEPKDNKGKWQLTIFDIDGNLLAGARGSFKWRHWG
jgi:hypothetical protein